MQRHVFHVRTAWACTALCAALALAACGGGKSGSPIPSVGPSTSPAPTPATLPTPAAQSQTATLTPSGTAPTSTALPAIAGIVPTVTLGKLAAGTGTISVTEATGADATMTARRRAESVRPMGMAGGPYLLQLDFVPSAALTFDAAPGFSLDVTQYVTSAGLSISQAAAYLQSQTLYAGVTDSAGAFSIVGPLTVSSTSASVTVNYAGPATAVQLLANAHYTIGIHLGPITAPTASPSASPSAAPSSSPSAAPSSSPSAAPTATPLPTATPAPTASPTVTYYSIPTANSDPTAITVGPDNNLWLTEWSADKIAQLTPAGTFTEFTLPVNTAPNDIVSGPDGNLYFTGYETGCSCIGSISTSGAISTYTIPQVSCQPYPEDLTVGPDRQIWFTDPACSIVGTFYPSSHTYGSLIGNLGGTPQTIASGSDGKLWFGDKASQHVETMATTASSLTTYSFPSGYNCAGFNNITSVIAGPDQNLWAAACGGIYKITTAGIVSAYVLPDQYSGEHPHALTVGADGNIWFTASAGSGNDEIGSITTSGAITEYHIAIAPGATSSSIGAITADGSGHLWFVDGNANAVGEFTP